MDRYREAHSSDRLLGEEIHKSIVDTVLNTQSSAGRTTVSIRGWWQGEVRWARNRISMSSARRSLKISIMRKIDGWIQGNAVTNQQDNESIAGAVRAAERASLSRQWSKTPARFEFDMPDFETPETYIWSADTLAVTAEDRIALVQAMNDKSEAQGMFAAGYIEMRAAEWTNYDSRNTERQYGVYSQSQCSMSVRHPKGLGSGWAGDSSFDWSSIDPIGIADVSLDKCLKSINPVRIEPGRYTVVLENQAVGGLVSAMMGSFYRNGPTGAESGRGPFVLGFDDALKLYRSKLGLKVVDSRISITHQVGDPLLGVIPSPGLRSVKFIEKGILTSLHVFGGLEYGRRSYNLPELNVDSPILRRSSFIMSGENSSMDEMIETTKRGLLVTRFDGLTILDLDSLLCTGFTRDGLWLIEDGKVTKAVHNMRITESPLFVLNQVEQLGVPKAVFRPVLDSDRFELTPAVVPSIKANDFSFTSLLDAV